MGSAEKSFHWTVLVGLGLVLGILVCLVVLLKHPAQTPRASTALPVIGPVAGFTLTNQAAQPVSLDDLKGRVWVADIIFTRCAGPCPEMTRKMKDLQDALPATSQARLVTLTTDADFDTPEILARYAGRYAADGRRWSFLTGDKVVVANLAIDSLKLTAVAKPPGERTDPNDLFVHSTIFVVVDKQGRLRGAFESVGEHIRWPEARQDILDAVRQLEEEP
ncbi:MAG: SCO family protein [Verrucomicrobia bacterium]|jgi:protein SCO1/2|nr:SCO family protein [Verrucomicrobiota bacterium]